ncbi:general stress protein [Arthrobacter sp. UM1]|uniref:general stress protein n=1 Tax=Arthrobacter sp. UM1 TaxID=2766776 RepID=UPI001CF66458|nr:general stress protein [Arthrobacter sp. UM1]MCB4208146.1 hypothetical protein [Arthrobacter sp. UM1]
MSHPISPQPGPSRPGASSVKPSAPPVQGAVLGSFSEYEGAQRLVDRLADAEFEVQKITIIGKDLVNVERVVQRLSYPKVALSAAMTGMTMGLLIGIGFALFLPDHSWMHVLPMMVIGACLWVIMNVIGYARQRGKRDFVSQSQIVASSYDVVCEPDAAASARALLARGPQGPGTPQSTDAPQERSGPGAPQGPDTRKGPPPSEGPFDERSF